MLRERRIVERADDNACARLSLWAGRLNERPVQPFEQSSARAPFLPAAHHGAMHQVSSAAPTILHKEALSTAHVGSFDVDLEVNLLRAVAPICSERIPEPGCRSVLRGKLLSRPPEPR